MTIIDNMFKDKELDALVKYDLATIDNIKGLEDLSKYDHDVIINRLAQELILMRQKMDHLNNLLFDAMANHNDPNHYINFHIDNLPTIYRDACKSLKELRQEVQYRTEIE